MSLLIDDLFNADPDSELKEKRKFNPHEGIDAIMKGGYYDAQAKKPMNPKWFLFHFDNPDNASHFAELFGGTPVTDEESTKPHNISLFPDEEKSARIAGVVKSDGVYADMRQFSNNKLIHHCTGTKFISHPVDQELIGTPCGCPTKLADRKKRADAEMGPKPNIEITFRLADDYEKVVKYVTGSWSLLRRLPPLVNSIIVKGRGGEALVMFGKVQLDSFENEKGQTITPVVPDVVVDKAWNDAIGE